VTTAAPSTALATIQPAFTDAERFALAGYRGLTATPAPWTCASSPAGLARRRADRRQDRPPRRDHHERHSRTLRHAFITAALDAGVPLRDVQEAASHADPRTAMRYDRGRRSLDRHTAYIVAAYLAGAPR
jgi:integrase